MATLDQARAAKQKALEVYGAHGRVVGVGITKLDEGYGLKVNFESAPARPGEMPEEIDGVPVRTEVVGKIRKL